MNRDYKLRAMKARLRIVSSILILSFCMVTPSFAFDDGSAEAVIADTIVGRPACFVATVVGSAFVIIALPFAAISRSVKETADVLIVKPAHATFTRPMGDFSSLQ